jgi:hypothetical protein
MADRYALQIATLVDEIPALLTGSINAHELKSVLATFYSA